MSLAGLHHVISLSQRKRKRQIADLVSEACSLVASDKGVQSVRIVASGRPTYIDLRHYQELARSRNVRVWVDGGGVIALRPEVEGKADF
jgi:hypothetical protein